jgi:hypothetical protein
MAVSCFVAALTVVASVDFTMIWLIVIWLASRLNWASKPAPTPLPRPTRMITAATPMMIQSLGRRGSRG